MGVTARDALTPEARHVIGTRLRAQEPWDALTTGDEALSDLCDAVYGGGGLDGRMTLQTDLADLVDPEHAGRRREVTDYDDWDRWLGRREVDRATRLAEIRRQEDARNRRWTYALVAALLVILASSLVAAAATGVLGTGARDAVSYAARAMRETVR